MIERHKRANQSRAEVFIDGKPASLADIIEASGDKEAWKACLEKRSDGFGDNHARSLLHLRPHVPALEVSQ